MPEPTKAELDALEENLDEDDPDTDDLGENDLCNCLHMVGKLCRCTIDCERPCESYK